MVFFPKLHKLVISVGNVTTPDITGATGLGPVAVSAWLAAESLLHPYSSTSCTGSTGDGFVVVPQHASERNSGLLYK